VEEVAVHPDDNIKVACDKDEDIFTRDIDNAYFSIGDGSEVILYDV